MRALADRWRCVGLLLTVAAGTAWGQAASPFRMQGRLGTSLVISDNLATGAARDRGALLSVSPGLNMSTRGAQVQGNLDYALTAIAPWRVNDRPDGLQHSLSASLRVAPRESGFSLNAQAGIGRQSQSAFGVQRPGGSGASNTLQNQAEVYSLGLVPSWQTRLGSLATLTLTHRVNATNTRDSLVGDSLTQDNSVLLSGVRRGALGWGLRIADTRNKPRVGRDTRTESAVANLSWQPDVDWQFGLNGGYERSNLQDQQTRDGATYGASASWRPTPRTSLLASTDRRVFGDTHSLSLEHRFTRATLRISESRNISAPGVVGSIGARTHYELLFAQLAAIEPDPDLRDALVRAQLQAQGLDPNGIATNGFISSRPSLTSQRQLSGTWQTVRSTWSLSASRSVSTRFGTALDGFDDFADSSRLTSSAASLSASYRLTPVAGLSAVLQWQRNEGDRADQRTELQSATLSWNTRLGQRQQLSAALRHSNFDSLQQPYEENALVLTFNQQF